MEKPGGQGEAASAWFAKPRPIRAKAFEKRFIMKRSLAAPPREASDECGSSSEPARPAPAAVMLRHVSSVDFHVELLGLGAVVLNGANAIAVSHLTTKPATEEQQGRLDAGQPHAPALNPGSRIVQAHADIDESKSDDNQIGHHVSP